MRADRRVVQLAERETVRHDLFPLRMPSLQDVGHFEQLLTFTSPSPTLPEGGKRRSGRMAWREHLASQSTTRRVMPAEVASSVRALGERFGVRNIRVFGSTARGDAGTDCDLDLVVEYIPGRGGFAFVEFCEQVEDLLGRKVDVVTEKSLHPIIRDRILAEALPL